MYKHEYKTGDRVVVKPWKLLEKQYGLTSKCVITIPASFTLKMEGRLCGTDRVIELGEATQGHFKGTGYLKEHNISPEMILGYAFECGDKCEVSDGGENWFPKIFSGYDPTSQDEPVRANEGDFTGITLGWRFARPVQKKITIKFFNENNEEITDLVSEETKKKLLQGDSRCGE